MSIRNVSLPVLLAACLPLIAAGEEAGEVPLLARNPFNRPPLMAGGGAAGLLQVAARLSEPPELRAVMLAEALSLANLGGHIVALGEERDGWRLTAVREDGVELVSEGRRVSVPLRTREKENQDE